MLMTARLADDWYGNKHTLIFLGGPQFVKMSYMITNSGPRYVEGILAIVCPLCALTNGVLSLPVLLGLHADDCHGGYGKCYQHFIPHNLPPIFLYDLLGL